MRAIKIRTLKGGEAAAERFKAWVCGSSLSGVVGSNPARITGVFLL